jgi:hypothetical protein
MKMCIDIQYLEDDFNMKKIFQHLWNHLNYFNYFNYCVIFSK